MAIWTNLLKLAWNQAYKAFHRQKQDTSKMTDAVQNETVQEENKLIAERRAKLDEIRKSCKANGHPNDFRRDALAGDLKKSSVKRLRKS